MFNRTAAIILVVMVISACASAAKIRELEEGVWQIDCSGGYHNWSGCHDFAKRICGKENFEIVSRVTNEGGSNVGSNDWSTAGSVVTRTMVVRCL